MATSGADIQPDKNWTKIHNTILELLSTSGFTAREFRCLLFLLRMTYGFNTKATNISLTEWEKGTGLKRSHVNTTLKSLVERKIIIKEQATPRSVPEWAFNKYFEEWTTDDVPNGVSKTGANSTQGGTSTPVEDSTPLGTKNGTPLGTSDSTPFYPENTAYKERKEKKENNNGSGCELPTEDIKEVTRFYETNIGSLTEYTKEELEALVSEYGGGAIVVDAMRVAVQANKKSLRYTHGVLRNWHADGRNGNKAPGLLPQATLPSTIPASVFDV